MVFTSRAGGVSAAPYDSFNLGTHVGDDATDVAANRARLAEVLGLPEERFVIGGAQYPDGFPWTPNTWFVRHLPPPEHPAFYCSSRLTLNVTREAMAAMGWCPSGRLFEAAACGVPILSDAWPGLDSFFEPGRDILVADTTEAAMAALALPRQDLEAIARRARERTLAEHSAARRAAEMVDALDRAVSSASPAATQRETV